MMMVIMDDDLIILVEDDHQHHDKFKYERFQDSRTSIAIDEGTGRNSRRQQESKPYALKPTRITPNS